MSYTIGERHTWAPHRVWWFVFSVLGLGPVAWTVGVGIRDAVTRPGGVSGIFYIWLVASIVWCVFLYRALLWPRLTADDNGLTVRNTFKTHTIVWTSIRSIEIRDHRQLRVITTDGSVVGVRALTAAASESGNRIGFDRIQEVATFLESWRQSESPMSSPD